MLRQLLGLRDTVTTVLQLEAQTAEDIPTIGSARAELNTHCDTYVARYGPLNRVTLARGKVDEDGHPTARRLVPPRSAGSKPTPSPCP